MARHSDACQRKTNPPRDLHINDRKSNGNAEAPVENIVQKRITRVIIVCAVWPQIGLLEYNVVQSSEGALGSQIVGERCHPGCHPLDAGGIFLDFKVWILRVGDGQSSANQIDLFIFDFRPSVGRKCLDEICVGSVMHNPMLTTMETPEIGTLVPAHGTFGHKRGVTSGACSAE